MDFKIIKAVTTPEKAPPGDLRCCCGRLLARAVPAGIEIKCRGCRRTVVIAAGDLLLADGAQIELRAIGTGGGG
jgi:hypothetical protein